MIVCWKPSPDRRSVYRDKAPIFLLATVLQLILLPQSLQQTQHSQNAHLLLPQETEQALTMLRTAGDAQLQNWAAKILDGPVRQPANPSSIPKGLSQSFQEAQPGNGQAAAGVSANTLGVQGGNATQGVGGSQPFLPASNMPVPFLPALQPTQPALGSPSPAGLPFLPPLLPLPQNDHARANALASSTAAAMAALDAALASTQSQGAGGSQSNVTTPSPAATQPSARTPAPESMVEVSPLTDNDRKRGAAESQSPVSTPSPAGTPQSGEISPGDVSAQARGHTENPSPSPTHADVPSTSPPLVAAPSHILPETGSPSRSPDTGSGHVQTFAGIRQDTSGAGTNTGVGPADSTSLLVAAVQSPSAAGPAEDVAAHPASAPIAIDAVQTAAAVRPSNQAPIRLSDVSAWPTDPFGRDDGGSSAGSWAGQEAGTHGTEPASEAVHQQIVKAADGAAPAEGPALTLVSSALHPGTPNPAPTSAAAPSVGSPLASEDVAASPEHAKASSAAPPLSTGEGAAGPLPTAPGPLPGFPQAPQLGVVGPLPLPQLPAGAAGPALLMPAAGPTLPLPVPMLVRPAQTQSAATQHMGPPPSTEDLPTAAPVGHTAGAPAAGQGVAVPLAEVALPQEAPSDACRLIRRTEASGHVFVECEQPTQALGSGHDSEIVPLWETATGPASAPAEGPSEALLLGSSAHSRSPSRGHRLSDYAKFGIGVGICGVGILLVAGCAFIGPVIPRPKKRKYDRKGNRLRPDSPRSMDQDQVYFPPLTYSSPPSSPAFKERSALDFDTQVPEDDMPATPSMGPGRPLIPGGGNNAGTDVEQQGTAGPVTNSLPYVIAGVRQPVSTRMGRTIAHNPPVAPYKGGSRGVTPSAAGPLPLPIVPGGPVSWSWVMARPDLAVDPPTTGPNHSHGFSNCSEVSLDPELGLPPPSESGSAGLSSRSANSDQSRGEPGVPGDQPDLAAGAAVAAAAAAASQHLFCRGMDATASLAHDASPHASVVHRSMFEPSPLPSNSGHPTSPAQKITIFQNPLAQGRRRIADPLRMDCLGNFGSAKAASPSPSGRRARSVSPMRRLLSRVVPGSPQRNAPRQATASEGHEPAVKEDLVVRPEPQEMLQNNTSADSLLDSGTSSFYDAEEARSWGKYSSRAMFFSMSESDISDTAVYNTAFSSMYASDGPTPPQGLTPNVSRPVTPEDPHITVTTIATSPPGSSAVPAPATPETIRQTVREIYLQAVRNATSSSESMSHASHPSESRSPAPGSPVDSARSSSASPDAGTSPRVAGDNETSPRSPRNKAGKLTRASSAILKTASETSPQGSSDLGMNQAKSKHRNDKADEDPVSWILD